MPTPAIEQYAYIHMCTNLRNCIYAHVYLISHARRIHYAQCLDHLRISWRFHIISQAHRMHYAHWLHPQKLRGHVQRLQESLKLGRLSPETLTSAWHRPGEELGASGTGDPSTHASKPCVWNRLGGGSEASRAAEAEAGWSMSRVWHRLGEG